MDTKRYKESRFTQKLIKDLIDYDPATGVAKWNEREYTLCMPENGGFDSRFITSFNKHNAGNVIDTVDGRGYISTSIKDYKVALHRLIFIYMTGLESVCTDHINGIKLDNRWENLRAVTDAENKQNVKRKIGESGYTGVRVINRVSGVGYRSQIRVNSKPIHLGMFDTAEEAAIAYNSAIDKYRNGYGRKNVVPLSEPT